MQSRHLIDSIVRHTTVLLAHLSTSAGLRAPLSHVADQVFVQLGQELERQGIRQKVVADMFGMALRSYQKKTRRLTESLTDENRTLWEAVLDHVGQEAPVTRSNVMRRFQRDDERDVAAVLGDLVESGLVYSTGRGANAVYGLATARDLLALTAGSEIEGLADLVWLKLFRSGPLATQQVAAELGVEVTRAESAVERLIQDQRIVQQGDAWVAEQLVVPVGATQGWEVAVLDHFSAVTAAIAAKLRSGGSPSRAEDRIGGATLTFDIWDGHPLEEDVVGLLARVRELGNDLWERVERHGASPPAGAQRRRVWFYFGQNVRDHDGANSGDREE